MRIPFAAFARSQSNSYSLSFFPPLLFHPSLAFFSDPTLLPLDTGLLVANAPSLPSPPSSVFPGALGVCESFDGARVERPFFADKNPTTSAQSRDCSLSSRLESASDPRRGKSSRVTTDGGNATFRASPRASIRKHILLPHPPRTRRQHERAGSSRGSCVDRLLVRHRCKHRFPGELCYPHKKTLGRRGETPARVKTHRVRARKKAEGGNLQVRQNSTLSRSSSKS